MYVPRSYSENDTKTLHAFIDAHPFATLVTAAEGLFATHLPLVLRPSDGPLGTLEGHIALATCSITKSLTSWPSGGSSEVPEQPRAGPSLRSGRQHLSLLRESDVADTSRPNTEPRHATGTIALERHGTDAWRQERIGDGGSQHDFIRGTPLHDEHGIAHLEGEAHVEFVAPIAADERPKLLGRRCPRRDW